MDETLAIPMKILAISWAMPPVLQPRSLQVARTLKELQRLGWETTVLCVDPRSLPRSFQLDDSLAGYYRHAFNAVRIASLGQSFIFRGAARILPFLKKLPDQERLWAQRGVPLARQLLSTENYSALISFAQPWSSHSVAIKLHRETKLPWVAHFSDPWTDSPYMTTSPRAMRFAQKMEETVFREADQLVFVNPYMMEKMLAKYPRDYEKKATVIPHGFDVDLIAGLRGEKNKSPNVVLTHIGQFYEQRMPWNLFDALAILKKEMGAAATINVRFVGSVSKKIRQRAETLGITSLVTFVDAQPFFKASELMLESDALLLIEAPRTNLFFSSKLVDYLAARKPILGLVPSPGPSADVLRKLQCKIVDPSNTEAIAASLKEFIEKKKREELFISNDFESYANDYDIRTTTRLFHSLLKNIVR